MKTQAVVETCERRVFSNENRASKFVKESIFKKNEKRTVSYRDTIYDSVSIWEKESESWLEEVDPRVSRRRETEGEMTAKEHRKPPRKGSRLKCRVLTTKKVKLISK